MNVLNHSLLGRSGINSVGIEALVKNKALEHGLSVDEEFLTVELYVAQAEIAVNLILIEAKLKIVKSALTDLPEIGFLEVEMSRDQSALRLNACGTHNPLLIECENLEFARTDNLCLNVNGAVFNVRENLDALDP